jgi:hypothetical protein
MPDYVKYMFEEYGYWRKQGRRGFIEFKFYYWEHLDNAINFIEDLPVYQSMPFVGMPGTPSYTPPSAKQLTLPMRRIPSEACGGFHEVRFLHKHEFTAFAPLNVPRLCKTTCVSQRIKRDPICSKLLTSRCKVMIFS